VRGLRGFFARIAGMFGRTRQEREMAEELDSHIQMHVDDAVRGRVLALWIMGFGGTVPLGVLVAGPLAQATSITLVLLIGAACAVGLAFYADLRAVGAPD